MKVFNNDHEVLQIGNLTIENGVESIIITGDVQIDKTPFGREQAAALYDFAQVLMAAFDVLKESPANSSKNNETIWVKNPFI